MSFEVIPLPTDPSTSDQDGSQTFSLLPPYTHDENENGEVGKNGEIDPKLMSPSLCKQGVLRTFENLVNNFLPTWKYHVANTDGIKEAWINFEDFYSNVCQFTGG